MKVIIAGNYFCKRHHHGCWTLFCICPGCWIYHRSEYTRVAHMLGLLMCFWFWIYQGSGYTTVLNMPGLHRVLNIPEYACIIPGYAWLCLDVSKSVWLSVRFCFLFQTEYFYKKNSKFAVTFADRVDLGAWILRYPTNDIPNKYIYDVF